MSPLPLLSIFVFLATISDSAELPISPVVSTLSSTSTVSRLSRDLARFRRILATAPGRNYVPLAPGGHLLQTTNYIVKASLGSPPQTLLVAVDTSNDAAWIPCSGCRGCPANSPSYTPSLSSTSRPVPCGSAECSQVENPSCSTMKACSFNQTYGSSSFQAELYQDSLSISTEGALKSFTFGCIKSLAGNSVPQQGLLGLGRGALSFVSQSRDLYLSTFSYCLPSYKSTNFSGTLRLGPKGQPVTIKTTPLLWNPHRPSFYYVNMTGIRVGRRILAIPPSALAFNPTTGGGTIVDSGTMFTMLAAPAYAALRDEFRRRVKAPAAAPLGGFDTCYNVSFSAPPLTLLFDGNVNVTLPEENVLIHSTYGSVACLAMAAAPADGINSALNVIASMQQQNHRVLFDLPNRRAGFARELCTF